MSGLYISVYNYIFLYKKEVNGKINSLRTVYSKELNKFSDSKKSGAALNDTYESPVSLKLI